MKGWAKAMSQPKRTAVPEHRTNAHWTRATVVAIFFCGLLCTGGVLAWSMGARAMAAPFAAVQQAETPGLKQRAPDDAPTRPAPPDKAAPPGQRPTTLPKDVSGAYAFDHTGESIEIDVDRGKLSGYITRLGDGETDSNTPLTYFFDRTALDGEQMQFETKVVHGVWYSFSGTVVRGAGQARSDAGYYVLQGTLMVHHPSNDRDKSSDETVEQREVHFKSLGQ